MTCARGDLSGILERLLAAGETEVVEFDLGRPGRYFSAIPNEVDVRGPDTARRVFGVDDRSHAVMGSGFQRAPGDVDVGGPFKGRARQGTARLNEGMDQDITRDGRTWDKGPLRGGGEF